MEIVKKNLISILCGVVALVGFSAWFWLVQPEVASQQAELDKRVATASSLKSLMTKTRTMPTGEPLEVFPNAKVIEAGNMLVDSVKTESASLLGNVTALNKLTPMVADAFPTPRSGTEQFQFRDTYNRLYVQPVKIQKELLQAGRPPTKEDIESAIQRLWRTNYETRVIRQQNGQTNEAELRAEYDLEKLKIPLEEQQRVALENKMYVEEKALKLNPQMVAASGAPPEPQVMWYAQVGIWIQETLAEAIRDTNASATNVLDAPVKHLVRIDINDNPYLSGNQQLSTNTNANMQVQPTGPAYAPNVKVPFKGSSSLTGRSSNSLYDVTHFRMVVRVDGRKIGEFLSQLGKNRLVYARTVAVSPVDTVVEQQAGYFYGQDPVVELTIDGEMLFLRSWTIGTPDHAGLMPLAVQQDLGIVAKPMAMPQ